VPISAVDSISLAFEHTKKQLFQPFRFGQWVRLAVVGLLAGELGSGGSCNRSNFNFPTHPGAPPSHSPFPYFPGVDLPLLISLVAVIVIAAFVLGIIFMYISSVMRFILFDGVLTKECHIRDGWMRRQAPGWRYFLWKLLYMLITFAGLIALAGVPLAYAFSMGWFKAPKEHVLGLVLGGFFLFFILMAFFITLMVVFVLTKDFVVPQMALEDISAFEGWRRLWPMIEAEKAGYAAYLGMKIVLAIAAGIMIAVATAILGLLIAIPTIGLSIIAVITGKTAGLTWNAYTITLAVVIGSVLLAIFLFLVSLISVPVIVFFPAYSIYFFASRYPTLSQELYALAQPSPQLLVASPTPPQQAPPSPPTPEPAG
jgi:MFS family permease